MFDYSTSTLFWIILTVLALITICLFLIAWVIVKGEREKERLFTGNIARAEREKVKKCQHFLGYLAEQPRHKPIPEECFGCTVAIDCIRATKNEDSDARKNITEAEGAIQQ